MSPALRPVAPAEIAGDRPPELYDLIYADYRPDIPFYVAQARAAAPGAVLEVACGTGRVHLPLLEAGADADGFDLQPAALELLRRKAAARGLTARVTVADMRGFTRPRRYALIVIPFRAFLHNLSTEDQLATLRCCREHLEPGGRLVLDLFHPSLDRLVEPDGVPRLEREFPHPQTGRALSVWTIRRSDRVNQTMRSVMELREAGPGGEVAVLDRSTFALRWVYKAEMELLLDAAGFARRAVAGGFDGRPLERDTDEMVWTAWQD